MQGFKRLLQALITHRDQKLDSQWIVSNASFLKAEDSNKETVKGSSVL